MSRWGFVFSQFVLNLLLKFWSLNIFTASVTERKNSLRLFYRYVEYELRCDSNKHIKLWATGIIYIPCTQRLCTSLGFVPDNCKDVNYYAIIHQLKYLAMLLLSQILRPLLGHWAKSKQRLIYPVINQWIKYILKSCFKKQCTTCVY